MLPKTIVPKTECDRFEEDYHRFLLYREEQMLVLNDLYEKLVRKTKLTPKDIQQLKQAAYFRNEQQERRLVEESIISLNEKKYNEYHHSLYVHETVSAYQDHKDPEKHFNGDYKRNGRTLWLILTLLIVPIDMIRYFYDPNNTHPAIDGFVITANMLVPSITIVTCLICSNIKSYKELYNNQKSVYTDSRFDQYTKLSHKKDN